MPYTSHSRSFRKNQYVYPVLSRRSRGISIGINLNPDKVCNFNCIYCQVDRSGPAEKGTDLFSAQPKINLSPFLQPICHELKETLELVKTSGIFSLSPFDRIPAELRHLSDIAISGDGEPTTSPYFYEAVEEVLKIKKGCFDDTKLVLITNASGLNRPKVRHAIDLMYQHNGEVWAKLDAGSDAYYRKVSRTNVPLQDIVRNLILTAQRHPIVIQSCFNNIDGITPPPDEIERYSLLLKEISESGGKIRLVQIYTVARPPAESYVTPLAEKELTLIAKKVEEITDIPTEIYG